MSALFLAAVVFTWPLALNPTRSIPAGGSPPTVALFGLFTMEWTGQALGAGRSYWDAPIFYPHRGTFAWSETQPITAVAVSILSRASGPIVAYNLMLWLYLAAFGLAGYVLARQLTTDRTAALWSSLWLTGGTYSIQQLGVLHLLAGAFPIACLASLLSLAREFRFQVAWLAGLTDLLAFLTCAQFGLFLTLLLPFVVIPLIAGQRGRWAWAAAGLAPLAAGLLLALPWLLRQRAYLQEMGFERSLVNVRGALLPADLLLPAKGHWLTGRLLGWSEAPDAYPWDLGLVPLACIATAAVSGGLRKRSLPPVARKQARLLLLLSITALLLGFGPNLEIPLGGGQIAPYAWLHEVVPGLSGVRTPSRFGMFAIVGIAALAAAALAFLRQRVATLGARRALTATAFALLAAEMWAVPVALVDPAQGVEDHRVVLRWLEEHGQGQPLVDLPMSAGDSEFDLEREARAMHRALRHRCPVVNGYSGYFPEPFRQLRWALREDPAGRGLRYLEALGVRFALAHHHLDSPTEGEGWLRPLRGVVVFRTGSDTVFRLPHAPAVRPLLPPSSTPRFYTLPAGGDILALPVAPADQARFFQAPPGHRLRVLWADELGIPHTTETRLGGSVLVDAGSPSVYVLIQRFPEGSSVGRAVLLSEEQVARGHRYDLRSRRGWLPGRKLQIEPVRKGSNFLAQISPQPAELFVPVGFVHIAHVLLDHLCTANRCVEIALQVAQIREDGPEAVGDVVDGRKREGPFIGLQHSEVKHPRDCPQCLVVSNLFNVREKRFAEYGKVCPLIGSDGWDLRIRALRLFAGQCPILLSLLVFPCGPTLFTSFRSRLHPANRSSGSCRARNRKRSTRRAISAVAFSRSAAWWNNRSAPRASRWTPLAAKTRESSPASSLTSAARPRSSSSAASSSRARATSYVIFAAANLCRAAASSRNASCGRPRPAAMRPSSHVRRTRASLSPSWLATSRDPRHQLGRFAMAAQVAKVHGEVEVQDVPQPPVTFLLDLRQNLQKDLHGALVLAHGLQRKSLVDQDALRARAHGCRLVKEGQGFGETALSPAQRRLQVEQPARVK